MRRSSNTKATLSLKPGDPYISPAKEIVQSKDKQERAQRPVRLEGYPLYLVRQSP